jgi:hypothetical protein
MNDRRRYSLLQIRELGHGIHDLPGFDTSDFRLFAVRLDPHENRLPIDRFAETLLLVVEGSLTVVWREAARVSSELSKGDTALTNPPGRRAAAGGRRGRDLHGDRGQGLGSVV